MSVSTHIHQSNMMFNNTLEEMLIRLNEEEVKRLAPLICFLIIIVITGVPGNFFVFLVYWKDFRESNSKFFIFSLAVSDFLSCFVVTLEIANVAQQYTFESEWLCKMTIFLETWVVMTSGYLLCIISIDRFRKVCHPFGWQINRKAARIACFIGTLLSLMCAWPAIMLYGVTEVKTHSQNITGYECGILSKYHETMSSKIYNGTLWLVFVTSLCLLIILYTLIIRKLFNQPKRTQSSVVPKAEHSSTGREDSEDMIEAEAVSTSSAFQPTWRTLKSLASSASSIRKSSIHPQTSSKSQSFRRSRSTSETRTMRSAYIMCIISVVFIASFLPYLILRLLEALDKNFVESLSDGGRAAHKSILRSYFLNCAINPFIYCACSTFFRRDLLRILRRLCCCK